MYIIVFWVFKEHFYAIELNICIKVNVEFGSFAMSSYNQKINETINRDSHITTIAIAIHFM
nr:hypothetical protein [bacterium]